MNNQRSCILKSNVPESGECVVYIMSRDQRVHDNHALLVAQNAAIDKKLPLVVLFCIQEGKGNRAKEHFSFMMRGLQQIEKRLQELNITFIVTVGDYDKEVVRLIKILKCCDIYFDFSPLRWARIVQKKIALKVDANCTVVDTHNVVPLWILSDKEEYAAHTIRRKVYKNLRNWIKEPDIIVRHPFSFEQHTSVFDWAKASSSISGIKSNGTVLQLEPGEYFARQQLEVFLKNRLNNYAKDRNNPVLESQSDLSPYLHFGQISSLRIVIEILKICEDEPLLFHQPKLASFKNEPTTMDSINAFIEELVVRKELADNYCFYNPNYDKLNGAKSWAIDSLDKHRSDERDFVYDLSVWEEARTHDTAWNAAQQQLMKTGKMHGYMRMYWAKKILEWSHSPEEAIQTAIYLNDHYSIDGGDPSGYAGIMWSIAGVHDRPWFERPVYGKIRFMNYSGLKRKFNIQGYIDKWD